MKLMVLDGNSILNRSYYGIRPLTTKDGFYTQAIYGFLVTMARLEDEERPDAVCVTFDRREPTFRHLEYEGYKAQRKGMPEELAMQLPVMKEVLDAMNIPRYELAGYEADDLIGTISRKCEAALWDCVVATGDKDSLQLITEHTTVKLISTRMGQTTTKRMTPESFAEEYGFEPIHIIDLKALMGDASDNIPGVPGIGEKTAMALVQKYRSIDEIYRLLPELDAKPGVIKKLTEGEESARQSYHLATVLTDAPLEFTPQDNLRKAPSDALYPLLMHLEFHKLIERMGLKPAAEPLSAAETVECTVTAETVTSAERAEECLARLRAADHVTVLALPDLSGVIVEWEKSEKETLSAEFFFDRYSGDWNALLRALFSADIKKVSHNVKDLMHTLLENGLPAEGFVFDTALAAYLIDATAGRYDIASLFAVYFHTQLAAPAHLEPGAFDLLGDVRAAETAFHIYTSAVGSLYKELAPRIEERQLHALYYEVELPLCRVLAEMELAGVRVDAKALADFGAAMDAELKTLEERIYEEADGSFNINSPKQLGEVHFEPGLGLLGDGKRRNWLVYAVGALYEELAPRWEIRARVTACRVLAEMELAGVRVDAKALADRRGNGRGAALEERIYEEAGRELQHQLPQAARRGAFDRLGPHGQTGWSTNADVLEKLRWEHPIVADVLQYRQYAKLKSTYCDGLLKVIGPDGRVRTSFQMTVTATGRLSSTEPNLQNIPTRTPLGSELRRMFVPERGNVLVDADYSQIELRLLAHIAGDETMRQAFLSGEDIHTVTASQVFGVPTEAVTKQMRSHAKAVNFGIVYGISAFSLAQDIGVSVYEAKEYIQNYLDRFSGVRRYMTEIVEKAKAQGYVETLMHRRRDLPELTASNFATRSFGERVALNMPIQGTAADVMKLAMVRVHDRLRREAPEAKLLLQVHDELIVECPEAMAEQAARLLTEEMEGVMQLSVPLVAEAHWGKNWLEAKG